MASDNPDGREFSRGYFGGYERGFETAKKNAWLNAEKNYGESVANNICNFEMFPSVVANIEKWKKPPGLDSPVALQIAQAKTLEDYAPRLSELTGAIIDMGEDDEEDDRVTGLQARVKELEAEVEKLEMVKTDMATAWDSASSRACLLADEAQDLCGMLNNKRAECDRLREENERLKKKLEASRGYR